MRQAFVIWGAATSPAFRGLGSALGVLATACGACPGAPDACVQSLRDQADDQLEGHLARRAAAWVDCAGMDGYSAHPCRGAVLAALSPDRGSDACLFPSRPIPHTSTGAAPARSPAGGTRGGWSAAPQQALPAVLLLIAACSFCLSWCELFSSGNECYQQITVPHRISECFPRGFQVSFQTGWRYGRRGLPLHADASDPLESLGSVGSRQGQRTSFTVVRDVPERPLHPEGSPAQQP
jgi:hypothetical protein